MRFALFGNDDLAVVLANGLGDSGHQLDLVVSLPPNKRPRTAAGLEKWSLVQGYEFLEWNGRDDLASPGIQALKQVDFAVASWPFILSAEVLALPKYGFIGTHPTPLPNGRGRHPLHWILAIGITSSEQVFFRMDEGIDTGRVLHRQPYHIEPDDNLDSLKVKLLECSREGAYLLGIKLQALHAFAASIPQQGNGTQFPARDIHQAVIDPRMSVAAVIRLHKSLGVSFPGPFIATKLGLLEVHEVYEARPGWSEWLPTGQLTKISPTVVRLRVDDGCLDIHLRAEDVESLMVDKRFLRPPSYYGHLIREFGD